MNFIKKKKNCIYIYIYSAKQEIFDGINSYTKIFRVANKIDSEFKFNILL